MVLNLIGVDRTPAGCVDYAGGIHTSEGSAVELRYLTEAGSGDIKVSFLDSRSKVS